MRTPNDVAHRIVEAYRDLCASQEPRRGADVSEHVAEWKLFHATRAEYYAALEELVGLSSPLGEDLERVLETLAACVMQEAQTPSKNAQECAEIAAETHKLRYEHALAMVHFFAACRGIE